MDSQDSSKPDTDGITAASLIRQMKSLGNQRLCKNCGQRIGHPDSLRKIALGMGANPCCFACLAVELGHSQDKLGSRLMDYIRQRDCYREAWAWAISQPAEDDPPTGSPTPGST